MRGGLVRHQPTMFEWIAQPADFLCRQTGRLIDKLREIRTPSFANPSISILAAITNALSTSPDEPAQSPIHYLALLGH